MKYRENIEFEKKFKEDGFASQRRYPNEALIQFLAGNYFSLPPKDRKHIKGLEIGCGSGANLWMIAKEGFDTYGLDNSATGLRLAKQMLANWGVTAKLQVGSMCDLPYESEFFDIVVDVVSVQHTDLKGHEATYKEVFRVLKPGGRFFEWHVGRESISFKKSGGNKIDELTVDNIKNSKVPLNNNGMICFLTPAWGGEALKVVGFTDIVIDRVTRTYNGTGDKIEYLAIKARKQ